MPNFTDILYQTHHRVRGAAWITINRPEVMNAFTGHTLTEMRDAVEAASGDPEVGVVVITGAGDRAFCAGGDVRWLQEVQREGAANAAPVDPHAGIEDCLKPVIARVNGYSVGGGNHLAYFADFTVASERATFAPGRGRRDRPRLLPKRRGRRGQARLPPAPRARLLPLPALTRQAVFTAAAAGTSASDTAG